MNKQQIGVIGLGVMGKNLALNIENKGFSVSVYDAWSDKVDEVKRVADAKQIACFYSLSGFAVSLEKPRKILLMVKSGEVTDAVINSLKEYISAGDIIIDGGNSYFRDTIRRFKELEKVGCRFIGAGISGGEEGALHGPAIMPGGDKDAYEMVRPVLERIAAKADGAPCCSYIGADGAGHFVKMVHNGIEYADMQLISEAYTLLKDIAGLTPEQLKNTFAAWNTGELNSYLIEITQDILGKYDGETGKPVLDIILDKAGQKGTGKWASQNALELDVAAPTIAEAVFARNISEIKEEREHAGRIFSWPQKTVKKQAEFTETVRKALYASKIFTYAQGFALMTTASEKYGWALKYGEIAMIFRGGCIIRAQFLNKIREAYKKDPQLPNLLLDAYFSKTVEDYQADLRKTVSKAVESGVPIPAFMSSIAYFDSYRSPRLSANLIQAQRDYFGAHMFERVDRPGFFHFDWSK